jgi:hypothetical protein
MLLATTPARYRSRAGVFSSRSGEKWAVVSGQWEVGKKIVLHVVRRVCHRPLACASRRQTSRRYGLHSHFAVT